MSGQKPRTRTPAGREMTAEGADEELGEEEEEGQAEREGPRRGWQGRKAVQVAKSKTGRRSDSSTASW